MSKAHTESCPRGLAVTQLQEMFSDFDHSSGESSMVGATLTLSYLVSHAMCTPSGDVIYLNAAGQPIVILNSQKVAANLLDRRAGIYSDRPCNIVARPTS